MSYIAQNLKIHAGFPGGNIIVEEYQNDTVKIRHDLSMCDGWWFWWCFEAENHGEDPYLVRFEFTEGSPIGIAGPCASINGNGWHWLGRECVDANTFEFRFTPEIKTCRFAFSIPYQESNLQKFLETRPDIKCLTLAKTPEARKVELLHIPSATGRYAIYFTARHHACECIANYVLEGIMDERLANRGRLSQDADFYVVPFMDKDGVENGDQGKNRPPHDHNRDYGFFVYETTRALIQLLTENRARNFMALDVHCPYMNDDKLFFVEPEKSQELEVFRQVFLEVRNNHLPYDPADDVPYNTGWNNATLANSCSGFLLNEGLVPRAFTMEVPYAEAHGIRINEERTRALGRDICRAIEQLISRDVNQQN